MAAVIANRDTDRQRNGHGHHQPERQQVKSDCPSRKWQCPTQAEGEDEDKTEPQQKRQKIDERSDQQPPQNPSASSKALCRSPRLQEKLGATQQRIARRQEARSPQRPAVKQYYRRNAKDEDLAALAAGLGAQKSTKRQLCGNIGDAPNHNAKRRKPRLTLHTEARIDPKKENFIEDWLDKSCWSRRTSTENEPRLSVESVNMPRHPTPMLPSPNNSSPSTISRTSEKSAVSVTDTDYRQSLGYRNIYINRIDPPAELMKRAKRIISRSRASPEIDDATAQGLIAISRRVENDSEDVIIQQLAPGIIPAMNKVPDSRLASNANSLWCDSIPVPLDPSILANPLPLPKSKPDLAFGYSEAAFTRNQLGTIDLLVNAQFGRSYAIPDQKIRFPFLEIEFISQAKNGTHYIATNRAAGAGAIALNGSLDLIQRSSHGMGKFDYNEPQYFSITMDHELARINVHWLKAPVEGEGRHSFHVEGLSKHLLDDANGIRAVRRAFKNILDNGADARLRTLCEALDAYRETVVRNREAANAQSTLDYKLLPES
ncbi:uncharacterized protein Z520_06911 [Fonsecaea multimorphosa CBS 102226]|uniref:DUF7924 domain-containing protein n=1 Tax=Fonsecaea multimorphosa CBS 102226 TaxID=1442371 RepID=A0A0D2K301_9EURO|nr:uncharacterized protein Z520_06911 [Fonsecaea multimorphosa CBS 102226]KIX97459.1 hypothetical protein Z520_06911 [Fonsecaea multimorphosa CBS 102226]